MARRDLHGGAGCGWGHPQVNQRRDSPPHRVDTPETVKPHSPVEPFGEEAAAFTRRLVQNNSFQVRLSFDSQRRDKYGRLLAYVWAGEYFLNEELVRAGLARVETQYSYSPLMKERLILAETEAKAQHRGIWSLSSSDK